MTLKKYQTIKLTIVVIIAIIFSQSIINGNYLIPLATLLISTLALIYFRGQVNEVIADERDYQLAGKSAGIAIQIYSWIAVVVMFILYSQKESNSYYEPVAMTLAFSTCILMFTYAFTFKYYNRKNLPGKNRHIQN